ncbi:MAG: tetratricopeptide repeat protein [Gemmatimonadota bacterium]|nr:tetratricopeptide repeat protein [Gemmatimonadota bacterium]
MVDSTGAYERGIDAPSFSLVNGDRASAERALRSTIQSSDGLECPGPEHTSALLKMGALKQEAGDYSEAEELFRRALEIGERALGPDHPALVAALTSLAAARIMCGKSETAEPLVARALSISENRLGEQDSDLVILLNDLARLCLKQSAHGVAEPLLLRLLAMKRTKGDDHPEVATVLASLASVRQALGRHESAEQLWRRVLDIRERTLAPNHFALATALEHLADSCSARGKLGEALQLFQRALTIRELTLGAGDSSLRVSRDRIADLQLQASEESLESTLEARAPAREKYRLLSADHSRVSAPRQVRTRSAVTQLRVTAPDIEREASTTEYIGPPSQLPVAEIDPGDVRPPQPGPGNYRDIILSIRQELEDDYDAETLRHRAAEVIGPVVAALRQRQKAAVITVSAMALLIVLAGVSRAWSESTPAATAEEISLIPGSRPTAVPSAAEVSSRSVALLNAAAKQPASASAAATPVGPSSRARVVEQRSPTKKATDRRSEPAAISIPHVSSALMAGFDSVVRARTAPPRGVSEPVAVALPPVSSAPQRLIFERDDQVIAPQRARLIGTLPAPRYPEQLLDVQADVRIRFEVDASGRPVMSSLSVLTSPNMFFTASVLKVIPGLRFEPARSGGPDSKAIKDVVQLGFQFRPTK